MAFPQRKLFTSPDHVGAPAGRLRRISRNAGQAAESAGKPAPGGGDRTGTGRAGSAPAAKPAAPAAMVRERVAVGVGEKGRGYGLGAVTTPVAAYFATKERIVFEIQLPESLKLYKAMNGHAPETEAEYMRDVVGPIQLPVLPPGHHYKYDPAQETLVVEHPR